VYHKTQGNIYRSWNTRRYTVKPRYTEGLGGASMIRYNEMLQINIFISIYDK